ncbi:endolysin [Erwinia phage vB_EamM-Y2]|uniref:Gp26 n=1 Tax=Erwinia phage vB_EamM-Y2 TaxID=1051676 RepID=G0YPX5_9CAUD|nr:endolysin [Erwinia phage vB_EamM-Y2]AEJ81402.1 gp26 [Erwinia phage vB_EamM-Y2]
MSNVKLGAASQARLNSVRMDLRRVCLKAFETLTFDVTVIEGVRDQKRQAQLFAEGKTKVMTSRHMSGNAVDMAPYPVDWNDTERFVILAHHMFAAAKELGITIRWGGNWSRIDENQKPPSSFVDMPHFELPA